MSSVSCSSNSFKTSADCAKLDFSQLKVPCCKVKSFVIPKTYTFVPFMTSVLEQEVHTRWEHKGRPIPSSEIVSSSQADHGKEGLISDEL